MEDEAQKTIYFPTPTIKNNTIRFYGAGIFGEESLTWNKDQATLAYLELHKFLFGNG